VTGEGVGEDRSSFLDRGGLWVLAQLPLLAAALIVPVVAGSAPSLGQPLSLLGLVLAGAGFLLTMAAATGLGSALTALPAPRNDASLHTDGLYGIVRHPIYAALLLAAAGWALAWSSLPGALVWLVLALFFDRKSRHEEKMLVARYSEYPAYAKRVRRFVPGLY
jgi:protein-S-isoprenylcysteine O-methyltransferase Ste14